MDEVEQAEKKEAKKRRRIETADPPTEKTTKEYFYVNSKRVPKSEMNLGESSQAKGGGAAASPSSGTCWTLQTHVTQ